MQVKRLDFLDKLNHLNAAVAKSEIVEQSTSFIFAGSRIIAFDDEVAIQVSQGGLKIKGAVEATELLSYLNKSRSEEVEIKMDGTDLILKAKRSEAGIRFQSEILIDISEIPTMKKIKFKKLPKNFRSALHKCVFSTSSNINRPALTCIQFKGDYASSCDGYRATRFKLSSKFKNTLLLPAHVSRIAQKMEINEYSIGKGWVHFKNDQGYMISARIFEAAFPDIEELIEEAGVEAEEISIPKEISELLDRAGIFARKGDQKTDELVTIKIGKNWCHVQSENEKGWIREKTRVKYSGDLQFRVNPSYLKEILSLTKSICVAENSLLFRTEDFDHVISLYPEGEEEE